MAKLKSQEDRQQYFIYPPVGEDDWRYMFQTAEVRALELHMLSRAVFLEMANAADFPEAVDALSASEYGATQPIKGLHAMEQMLLARRADLRAFFEDLMIDESVAELMRSRTDFANLRLAVRRLVTDKPLGTDYSPGGNVEPETFAPALQEDNPGMLPVFLQEASEEAVLAYYDHKDIRDIDYSIDRFQTDYQLKRAAEMGSVFLTSLFAIQTDLTNLRTLFRLKYMDSDDKSAFLDGGFLRMFRFEHALELGLDALASAFATTPYADIVENGVAYLASKQSFLAVEQRCEAYMLGFLRKTSTITAGPQPVIAYLLAKEQEIRTIRLVLTAKKSRLDSKLILDRIPQNLL